MKSPGKPITADQLDARTKKYLERSCNERPDGHYACKKCGALIKAAEVFITILRGPNNLADKEVAKHHIPFCPNCEDEPQSSFQIRA